GPSGLPSVSPVSSTPEASGAGRRGALRAPGAGGRRRRGTDADSRPRGGSAPRPRGGGRAAAADLRVVPEIRAGEGGVAAPPEQPLGADGLRPGVAAAALQVAGRDPSGARRDPEG